MSKIIHACHWSSQPNILILCDQSWTTPKWGSPKETETGLDKVYLSDDDRLYTFEDDKVTCKECQKSFKINKD